MRIQNNITALNTHRQYGIANAAVAGSAEKLASGYRINRAGDDAAGLAISEKMRAQIRGLNMASKNSQDAVSLIQTAEGALQSTHNILQRMRELAVQASSDTNETKIDRGALDQEFQQLIKEIDDTASKTRFNDMNLIDGSYAQNLKTALANNAPGITAWAGSKAVDGNYTLVTSVVQVKPQVTGATGTISVTKAIDTGVNGVVATFTAGSGSESDTINGNWQLAYNPNHEGGPKFTLTNQSTGEVRSAIADITIGATNGKAVIDFGDIGKIEIENTTSGQIDGTTQLQGLSGTITIKDAVAPKNAEWKHVATLNGEQVELQAGQTTVYFANSNISVKLSNPIAALNTKTTMVLNPGSSSVGTAAVVLSNIAAIAPSVGGVLATGAWAQPATGPADSSMVTSVFTYTNTLTHSSLNGEWTIKVGDDGQLIATNGTLTYKGDLTVDGMNDGDVRNIIFTDDDGNELGALQLDADQGVNVPLVKGDEIGTFTVGGATAAAPGAPASTLLTAITTSIAAEASPTYDMTLNGDWAISIDGGKYIATNGRTQEKIVSDTVVASLTAAGNIDVDFGKLGTLTMTFAAAFNAADGTPLATLSVKNVNAQYSPEDPTAYEINANGTNATEIEVNVKTTSRDPMVIQSGANQGDELRISIEKMDAQTLGVRTANVASRADASVSISQVNNAINTVSTQRAALGAMQNRLDFKIANLDNSAENLQAAESRIRDIDMAREMTEFSKKNILVQAATAMLAQANAAPQNVLSLLR